MTINDMLVFESMISFSFSSSLIVTIAIAIAFIIFFIMSRGLVADVWGGMQEMRRLVGNTMFLPLIVRLKFYLKKKDFAS